VALGCGYKTTPESIGAKWGNLRGSCLAPPEKLIDQLIIVTPRSWWRRSAAMPAPRDGYCGRPLSGRRGLTLPVSVRCRSNMKLCDASRTSQCVDAFVGDVEALPTVAAVAEPVQLAYLWRPALPDVDDDMVLEAAVSAG
jgi:hypothetical protein